MANFYKNAFYDPTVTTAVTTYTCPSNANAIIQNIQVTNESGSKVLKASITDATNTSTIQIAYAAITGPTICNIAKGPIILEESDSLNIECDTSNAVSAVVSILEINRSDQNG